MTSDTCGQEPKSRDAQRLVKLSRMLRSMSQKLPNSSLITTQDGFGVRLEDGRFLHIVRSGNWTPEDLRDFLALFATWLAVDADRLIGDGIVAGGYSSTDRGRALR